MIIATLKEISTDENRVAISPDICKQYCKRGFSVIIEKNAGVKSSFLDTDYQNNGAKVLLHNVQKPELYGVAKVNKNNKIIKIVEKPKNLFLTMLYLGYIFLTIK